MLIAWGAMPESTTGAKSRLVHAGAMPMRWGAATQRGRGAMPIEAGIAHIGCIPNFSTPVFDFFLVWPYKNRVFSFFSFFSSFWAYRPAAVLQLERAGGFAQNEEKKGPLWGPPRCMLAAFWCDLRPLCNRCMRSKEITIYPAHVRS